MQNFGLTKKTRETFLQEYHNMQRLLETNKYDRTKLITDQTSISELQDSFKWKNWVALQDKSIYFLEKQILDLNTTTQTTSRNNESLLAKKRDSDIMMHSFRKNSKIIEEQNKSGKDLILKQTEAGKLVVERFKLQIEQ